LSFQSGLEWIFVEKASFRINWIIEAFWMYNFGKEEMDF